MTPTGIIGLPGPERNETPLRAAHGAWQRDPTNRKRVLELESHLRRVSTYTGVPMWALLDRLTATYRGSDQ